jgi:hypothetical protein
MRFRFVICSKRCAVGGEAATVTRTGFSSFEASLEAQRRVLTVGAALKCVMFSVLRSFQIRG